MSPDSALGIRSLIPTWLFYRVTKAVARVSLLRSLLSQRVISETERGGASVQGGGSEKKG